VIVSATSEAHLTWIIKGWEKEEMPAQKRIGRGDNVREGGTA